MKQYIIKFLSTSKFTYNRHVNSWCNCDHNTKMIRLFTRKQVNVIVEEGIHTYMHMHVQQLWPLPVQPFLDWVWCIGQRKADTPPVFSWGHQESAWTADQVLEPSSEFLLTAWNQSSVWKLLWHLIGKCWLRKCLELHVYSATKYCPQKNSL